ncbi:DUF3592 domain-containing protein [Mucilaginibacter sp. ZT4R22]|uniref:DUF3592 domain-containing protein n=1 Tax=Mucilaginibacter pankratovii TaxID=2772110 RepID=A0ABR7WU40_9SPHI|nr:DUF3592 domain-containing protein [Mucilaginibacter pankratovii]MBD1365820.1 DUF3592 domain-containing protein [Mucilaginibacter pankratovii]
MLNLIIAASYTSTHVSINNIYYQCAVVIAIGITAIYAGVIKFIRRAKFMKNGVWTEGEVIKIIEVAGSDDKPVYYPVITYTTLENEVITTHYDAMQSRPSLYSLNEKVPVVYDPADKREYIIDNKSGKAGAWIFLVFGLLFLLFGLFRLLSFNQFA